MVHMARAVTPDIPQHGTHRGDQGQPPHVHGGDRAYADRLMEILKWSVSMGKRIQRDA